MDRSAIKNFAVRARNKLIEDITQKVYEIGISKDEIKDIETFEGGFKVKGFENGKIYKKYEVQQRDRLVTDIKDKGFEHVIEEVAYTWFNRFIALRFMEVNEYLPTGVRVLSSVQEGKSEPDIIKEALNIDFDLVDKEYDEYKEIVYRLIDANDTYDLYRYLLVKQCNQLGRIMPMVFEEISDYTELLLPDHLLEEGSVIRDLVESVEDDNYKDQVEIIGWMYQYYISEKKDKVFAGLKNNKKITKENIPAATQLFTPKWIVKYMVENSLGRLWLESHPDEELQSKWKYYLEEAEQDPEVQKKLDELKDPNLNPEDIKVLDPAMGSGHILVYAFDVLYDIYLKANYSERDIPRLILEKNLYGLDIDDRAGQLAAFALMMKARSKNRRIFRRKIDLNICSIQESNGLPKEAIDFLVSPKDTALEGHVHKEEIEYLIEVFYDAKEYGSILDVKKINFDAIDRRLEEIRNGDTLDLYELQYREIILERLPDIIKQGRIMTDKYDVVCTNPPYMGNGGMNAKLLNFTQNKYPLSKGDLFAIFMDKALSLVKDNKYISMITMQSWMYLPMFKDFRKELFTNNIFSSIIHLGSRAFEEIKGEKVKAVIYISRNLRCIKNIPVFVKLTDFNNHLQKEKQFFISDNYFSSINQEFIVGSKKVLPTYEISTNTVKIFNKVDKLDSFFDVKRCLATGKDEWFVRQWTEVDFRNVYFQRYNHERDGYKWFPVVNGGEFRRWYGNNIDVLNWQNNGEVIKDYHQEGKINATLRNLQYFFVNSLTYTYTSMGSGRFNVRYIGEGFVSLGVGPIITLQDRIGVLGYLNSKVFSYLYSILFGKTSTFETGSIGYIPCILNYINDVDIITQECIDLSKNDWDSFETSWDFKIHPLIKFRQYNALWGDPSAQDFRNNGSIGLSYKAWELFTNEQFTQLKANEEELNRIFIDIYGLQDELTPEVEDKDITISKADRERDIKSFISYAVGCMFGRYSLDEEGLVYAGGKFDIDRYETFIPTKDNILVIADDDYFEDDIVNRFVEFVKITFGEATLEENLNYIAETLGQKANETSRHTIRRYFLKDFYKDHLKTYQNRPIYWLFDSGKADGFKALVYMHRYDISTVARVRTDYLHKLQRMYEAEVKRLDFIIDSELSAREKAAGKKKKDNINNQIEECIIYDQVIAHIAHQRIEMDLDDGVKHNYDLFQGIEVSKGEGRKPLKANLLAKI